MQRILVKAAPGLAVPRLSFGASPVTFKATRLFESIDAQPALGAAGGEVWHILTPPPGFAEANGWDICHSLMQQGFGVAGAPAPTFAEPDLEQRWITGQVHRGRPVAGAVMRERGPAKSRFSPRHRQQLLVPRRLALAIRRRHRRDRRAAGGLESPYCAFRHRLRPQSSYPAEAAAARYRAQFRR